MKKNELTKEMLINKIKNDIINLKKNDDEFKQINDISIIIGSDAIIKSRELFDILLSIEDFLLTFTIEFDWPSMMINEKVTRKTSNNITDFVDFIFQEYVK